MQIEGIIVNLIFSSCSMLAFYYIYKKTHLNVALLGAVMCYIELLIRTIFFNNPVIIGKLSLLNVPEIGIMLYFIIVTYYEGFRWIPGMITVVMIAYALLSNIGHTFHGEIGAMLALILIIWVSQSKRPCSINPWECKSHDRCNKPHSCRDDGHKG